MEVGTKSDIPSGEPAPCSGQFQGFKMGGNPSILPGPRAFEIAVNVLQGVKSKTSFPISINRVVSHAFGICERQKWFQRCVVVIFLESGPSVEYMVIQCIRYLVSKVPSLPDEPIITVLNTTEAF